MVLEKLGAKVEKVRPGQKSPHFLPSKAEHRAASIVDQKQFVNMARQRALEFGRSDLTDGRHGHPLADDLVVTTSGTKSGRSTPDSASSSSSSSASHNTQQLHADTAATYAPRGFFADQFENESNFNAHYHGTGPEIFRQTTGKLDAFVSGAGPFNVSLEQRIGRTNLRPRHWRDHRRRRSVPQTICIQSSSGTCGSRRIRTFQQSEIQCHV